MRARLYPTLVAIAAVVGIVGPDVLAAFDDVALPRWLSILFRALGCVVALCANGRAVALLNLLMPGARSEAAPVPATTPTPVTRPETPSSKAARP